MKKNNIILLFLIVSSFNLFSQSVRKFVSDSLDIYVNRALENWQIPGAAILVVKDGKIIVASGYGVKEIGTNDKVDENTLFLIGSNTKAFTGTALALLENEGKLNLEDKVTEYLPDFKMKDEWVTKQLNLQDIVSHRMGFETFQGDFIYWTSDLNADEVIEKFGKITPNYDFRTKYGYTNAGYVVAGKVIEAVSGLTWGEYVKERIFKPLNMDKTVALSLDYSRSHNVAKPHTVLNEKVFVLPFENLDNMAPCGSIGSSVVDLSHWLIAQLDSGMFKGKMAIPFSAIQKTRQLLTIERRVKHPYNKTHYTLYGMGWEFQDYEGREIISHTGGVNGFVTSVTLMPEEKLGIVVLTNNDQNAFFQSLKWEILDAYLGLPYRNYDGNFYERSIIRNQEREKQITAFKDSVEMNLQPLLDISEFTGIYNNEVYGYAELKLKENYLEMHMQHHSKITGKLEYIGNNRFLCTYSDPLFGIKVFPFNIEDGKIKSFDLYVDDFIDYQPYKFVKN